MVERMGWRIAVGVLVALMAGAAPALAQPASSPPHSWTGFHVGLNFGYGWGTEAINVSGDPLSEFVITQGVLPPSLADNPSGIIGGVQGGYSYQIGLLVLGLEADAQGADISDRQTVTSNVPGFFSFSTTAEQKLDMVGTVRGRVGFTPFAPLLVYATGGLAYGHASLSASVTNPGCVGICSEGSTSSMEAGWTAGGGVEYAFSSHWSMRAEYLYYDLGTISKDISDVRSPGIHQTFSTDLKGNIVRIGVNYKF